MSNLLRFASVLVVEGVCYFIITITLLFLEVYYICDRRCHTIDAEERPLQWHAPGTMHCPVPWWAAVHCGWSVVNTCPQSMMRGVYSPAVTVGKFVFARFLAIGSGARMNQVAWDQRKH